MPTDDRPTWRALFERADVLDVDEEAIRDALDRRRSGEPE